MSEIHMRNKIHWSKVKHQILHFAHGTVKLEGEEGSRSYYYYTNDEKLLIYWFGHEKYNAHKFLELNRE